MNLSKNEAKEIEKHDTVFKRPLEMFHSNPYNETFIEKRTVVLHANPDSKTSDSYTFTHNGDGVGVLKTSDARLRADFQCTMNDDAVIHAGAVFVPPPLILRTLFKSKELKINDTLVTLADNFGPVISYLRWLTRDCANRKGWEDGQEINCAFFDTPGQFESLVGFDEADDQNVVNTGGRTRQKQFRIANNAMPTVHYIDALDITGFNESGDELYIPSVLKLVLTLQRANNSLVCMGANRVDANNADNILTNVNNARINITNFELHIPVYKPNDQLMGALNKMFGEQQEEGKYYTSEFRCITANLPADRRNYQSNDVFNGNVPTRLYIMISRQNNFNGTFATNAFRFRWENISHCQISVNSANVGEPLKNSKQAYEQLRHVLGRVHRRMPFKYSEYESDYGIIAYDLTPSDDSSQQFLPIRPNGILNVNLEFSANTPAGVIIYIGEFRNQLNRHQDTGKKVVR